MNRLRRWTASLLIALGLLLLGPVGVMTLGNLNLHSHWREAAFEAQGKAPDPRAFRPAVVQVYGARAYNWRGAFGIHTWIASKRAGAEDYRIYQVIGWNLYRGRSTVSVSSTRTPDFYWFNSPPELLAERRGESAARLIDRLEEAVAGYPYADKYRVWPGPNSNSFTAYVARQIPELGLDLPPTAIGKDYLVDGSLVGLLPSGSGWQLSLFGLMGIGVGWEEGVELNLLGLSVGIDVNDLALRLPGIGRVEVWKQT